MENINYLESAEKAYGGLELEIVQACMTIVNMRRSELTELFGRADFKLVKIDFSIDEVLELVSEKYKVYEVLNIIELGHIVRKNGDTWNDLTFEEDQVKIMIEDYI